MKQRNIKSKDQIYVYIIVCDMKSSINIYNYTNIYDHPYISIVPIINIDSIGIIMIIYIDNIRKLYK